ncbi:uncharacterized protein LOC126743854 [Anthonomus grandis grandis]|uniref:uncharacterized protein LOC126743854 n=1 Tax=Anthonomus grandis grandis TaxID=2921223 RepID=UPI002165AD9D|nr:uncharacterized protein LOC126743854 [Anthonomus grandis grandis]
MFKPKNADCQFLNNTTLPRLNATCNGAPKMTSTPLGLESTPKKGKLRLTPVARQGTPKRYSLSDISPKSNPTTSSKNVTIKTSHSPGLLLSPMNPKDSISMYEETKSSGLARRIVLYNEEAKQTQNQTHQEQYNSPGLFPIVHLFKESPSLLQQPPKRVKIKLANSDYTRNFLTHQRSPVLEGLNRKKLERQQSLPPLSPNDTVTSTKSVLDALKEISRKRIHSNEGYEHEEEVGKRVRTDLRNGCAYLANKRSRSDSSPPLSTSGTPSPKQTQKKMCVYDEFTASKSSSDFSFLTQAEPVRFLKKKTISTSTESISEPKQINSVTASTQTIVPTTSSKADEKETVETEKPPKEAKEKSVVLKVFDDAPLENMRKNRLATLLGNLAGKDMSIFRAKKLEEEPLKSILSSPNDPKTDKTEKHVHFNVPSPQPSITQVSASIVTPIVSDSVKQSPILTESSKKVTEIFSVKPSLTSSDTSIAKSPMSSSFVANNVTKQDSASSFSIVGSSPKITEAPKASVGFSFGSNVEKLNTTTPSFGTTPNTTTVTPVSSSSGFGDMQSVTKTAPTFSFGTSVEQKSTTTSVATTSASSFNFTRSATPTFGTTKQEQTQSKPAQTFGTPVTTSSSFGSVSTTAAPTFGLTVSSSSTTLLGVSASSTAFPSFGMPSVTTTASLGFGGNNTAITTVAPSFGTGSAAPPAFGGGGTASITNIPSFGSSTAPATFGQTTTASTTSAITFGSGSTTSLAFGPTKTASTTSGIMFGAGSTAPSGFGQTKTPSTTSAITFGSGSTAPPAFGQAATASAASAMTFGSSSSIPSAFGQATALTTSAMTFGSGSTAPPTFGQAATTAVPTFGSSSAPSAFGSAAPSTSAPIFGAGAPSSNTSSLSFGPVAPSFGFGSTPTTIAATTTAPPSFGSAFGTSATTTASAFGAGSNPTSAPPAFGSSNMFGSTTQATPFGGFNAQPQFGRTAPTTTTTATATFGGFGSAPAVTTAAPSFGFGAASSQPPPNPFGTPTTTASSTFGTPSGNFGGFGGGSSSTFGGQSGFNQTEQQKSTFSFGGAENRPTTPSFGSGNSAFGKTSAPQTGFGSTSVAAGGFGSTSSNPTFKPQQANGGFNFGQTTPSSSFAFGGSSGETPKPSFNFTGGSTNAPSFGTPNPSFGAAAPQPTFGAVGTPTFNIGAGSAPSGRRAQRAKRRT